MNTLEQIVAFFEEAGIEYARRDHEAVFTCETAGAAVEGFPGYRTKNLFMVSKKGEFFLLVAPDSKRVDIKALAEKIGVGRLSFGSEAQMLDLLGISPGSVTPLALVNDTGRAVRLLIDEDVWDGEEVQCHPLVNTSTFAIPREGLVKFFVRIEHNPEVMSVPERS